jgi:hypothetical protein
MTKKVRRKAQLLRINATFDDLVLVTVTGDDEIARQRVLAEVERRTRRTPAATAEVLREAERLAQPRDPNDAHWDEMHSGSWIKAFDPGRLDAVEKTLKEMLEEEIDGAKKAMEEALQLLRKGA